MLRATTAARCPDENTLSAFVEGSLGEADARALERLGAPREAVVLAPVHAAVAIALLPTILPQSSLWSYPWQVLFGSVAFIVISKVCFKRSELVVVIAGTSSE
jgi:hypothetical protein